MSSDNAPDPESVRAIVNEFYLRLQKDLMIGFFFKGKDIERLIDKEVELALEIFGVAGSYRGRPIDAVHRPLKIMGGQFDRRAQILKDVLAESEFPKEWTTLWLSHTEKLRDQVTFDSKGHCEGK